MTVFDWAVLCCAMLSRLSWRRCVPVHSRSSGTGSSNNRRQRRRQQRQPGLETLQVLDPLGGLLLVMGQVAVMMMRQLSCCNGL
jgi:hypothetical protein